jgi:predicted RNA-binding Zn-ribbon protein involved in translation (DUF1610 family)
MIKLVNDEIEQAFREGYAQGKKDAVKYAIWEKASDDEYYCGRCGGTAPLAHDHRHIVTTSYCPHCGAEMIKRG